MATVAAADPFAFSDDGGYHRGITLGSYSFNNYVAGGGSSMTVSDLLSVGLTRIRLMLAAPAAPDATWTTTGNYTLTGTGSPTVSSVKVSPDNSYIDLITTAQTAAAVYTVAWSGLTGITGGSDTVTAVALANGGITAASGCASNTINGNILPQNAVVDVYDSVGNTVNGNVCLAVVWR